MLVSFRQHGHVHLGFVYFSACVQFFVLFSFKHLRFRIIWVCTSQYLQLHSQGCLVQVCWYSILFNLRPSGSCTSEGSNRGPITQKLETACLISCTCVGIIIWNSISGTEVNRMFKANQLFFKSLALWNSGDKTDLNQQAMYVVDFTPGFNHQSFRLQPPVPQTSTTSPTGFNHQSHRLQPPQSLLIKPQNVFKKQKRRTGSPERAIIAWLIQVGLDLTATLDETWVTFRLCIRTGKFGTCFNASPTLRVKLPKFGSLELQTLPRSPVQLSDAPNQTSPNLVRCP